MSDKSTLDRLTALLDDQLGLKPGEVITPEMSFLDDLNCDSLDLVELVMAAQEEFLIEISYEEAEPIKTVADAVALIDRIVAATPDQVKRSFPER